MNRSAIYHDNNRFRVISVPNGLWQPQFHGNSAGTDKIDPWLPIGRPTTREWAISVMDIAAKEQQSATNEKHRGNYPVA